MTGKLGQSLRKYTEEQGQPDFELEKFAINSLISATHTAEMDEEDRKDIIKKINTSGDENDSEDSGLSGTDDNNDSGDDSNDNAGDNSFDMGSDEEDLQELSIYENKEPNIFLENPPKNNMFQKGSNDILKEGGDDENQTRYMFFSNLEQMKRQCGLLLDLDEGQIEAILNSGHDWAADHIAEAKNNMDQVFDFLMNETKNEDDEYVEWSKPMEIQQDVPVSSELAYHLQNEIALGESVFRYGSDKFFSLLKEVKSLYSKGLITLNENDSFIVNDFDLGYLQVGDDKIKMNFIFEEIDESKSSLEKEFNSLNKTYLKLDKEMDVLAKNNQDTTEIEEKLETIQKRMSQISSEMENDLLKEAEYQGKKVEIGKPKRGGSKKFYVYVKNPKTGKIKKVSFGAKSGGGNLAVKLKDPKARKAFADRHNCEQKNDKTKAGYWACRLPRYAKLLGLSGGGKWW